MSISSISGSSSLGVQQLLNTNRVSGTPSRSDTTSGASSVAQNEGDAFLKSLFAALDALDLQAPPPPPEGRASAQATSTGMDGTSSEAALPDALNAFISTLFQTLASGSSGTSSTSEGSYSDIESRLQSLISSLSASDTSSASGTSDLQDAFKALKSAIANENSATGGSATETSSTTLQSFLQNLLGNLQSQSTAVASFASSGSLVKTYA
jgi:hypothetical protein